MTKKILVLLMLAVVAVGGFSVYAQQATDEVSYQTVLSKLQSMGHGYYSAQDWAQIEADVDNLVQNALTLNDGNAYVRATIVKAMTLGDMRRRYDEAVALLESARVKAETMLDVDASPLFVKEAEMYAELGNASAVVRLINEYKDSTYYDPKPYYWGGASQPGEPLMIARPNATTGDSIPLTKMEKALTRARSAPGMAFPDATLTDIYGRTFSIADFRGKVLLVDFFARGWRLWEDFLPQQVDIWTRYNAEGFEVVSVCLEYNAQGLEQLGLPWAVTTRDASLTKALGIFGETTSYLLNQDGMIIARDLRGQDLLFAVRQALGL